MNTQAAWKPGSGKATSSANSVTILCVAPDGSGGSKETPKCLRQVAIGVATFSLCQLSDTPFELWRTIRVPSRADEKVHIQLPIDGTYVTKCVTPRG